LSFEFLVISFELRSRFATRFRHGPAVAEGYGGQTVDVIKAKLPEANLSWAAEGLVQPWKTHFKRRSQRYTTRWDELLEVV
jgi:hypothetical protein